LRKACEKDMKKYEVMRKKPYGKGNFSGSRDNLQGFHGYSEEMGVCGEEKL